jgi:hypothetical protein
MKICFSMVDEFLAELEDDGPPSKIVRMCRGLRPTRFSPTLYQLAFFAGFMNVRGELVELEADCGERFGGEHALDSKAEERANQLMDVVETRARKLGHATRAGRFTVSD